MSLAALRPSLVQSIGVSVSLVVLSIALAPFTLAFLAIYSLINPRTPPRSGSGQERTVLITGARTTKSLVLLRTFYRAGYRCILAEEDTWGWLCATRFSRGVTQYYPLPSPIDDKKGYIAAIQAIVTKENVSAWIPGSSAGGTLVDAEAGEVIRRTTPGCEVFIQSVDVATTLHFKDLFLELVKDLGMATPESQLVTSVEAAQEFLFAKAQLVRPSVKFILKCLDLDDLGRSDLTLLPFKTTESTLAHLAQVPLPISPRYPYVLQQFITGSEYCTHAHVKAGELRSFLAAPSNDMLMRYISCDAMSRVDGVDKLEADSIRIIGEKAEEWTREFLTKWGARLEKENRLDELTGHFSFDFIVDASGTLFPIECNPRIHTAITLFASLPAPLLADSYFASTPATIHPLPSQAPISWIAHSLPLSLASVVPSALANAMHPYLALPSDDKDFLQSPSANAGPISVISAYLLGTEVDALFDKEDLLPFFALAHIHWPWLLLRQLFRQRVGWSRLNVSTSRIFEC